MKRPTYIIIFIAIVISVLTVLQIGVANQISTTGADLANLQKKVADFERENTILQEQILDAASYTNISEKADELGYAPSSSQVYLNTPLPLAYKQ
jgi:cell division protein FtsL